VPQRRDSCSATSSPRSPTPKRSQDLADAAQLCLTELVTNAILHGGGGRIAVRVSVDGVVRLEVRDDSSTQPRILVHTASSGTGRGLNLVARLSTQWGSESDAAGGKVVWCEVSAESAGRRGAEAADPWLAELGDLVAATDTAVTGASDATDAEGPPHDVHLLRYPVRRGLLAREHYRSLLRECQLRGLHSPQDLDAATTTAAARLLVEVYTGWLESEHRLGSDLSATQDALLTAHGRGNRATDLTVPVGERAHELLAAVQAALAQVRLATSAEADLLTEKAPREVVELDDWTMQQHARQLAGEPPTPWAGPLG